MQNAYNTLELPDGRLLGFGIFGDPEGYPTLYFHGWPGSRFEGRMLNPVTKDARIKLIAIDRPGIGLSSKQKERTLLDWPTDIIYLLDHLGINECIIIGHSGGAPYAYACAKSLPNERLTAIIITSGVGPVELGTNKMKPIFRFGLFLVRKHPKFLKFLFRLFFYPNFKTLKRATLTSKIYYLRVPRRDKDCIKSQNGMESFILTNYNVYLQDVTGTFQDLRIYATNWGFSLNELSLDVPLFLLHGEKDEVVPIQMAKSAADCLENCTSYFFPEESHFSTPFNHLGEILKKILLSNS